MKQIMLMTALGAGNLGDEMIAWCEYRSLRVRYPDAVIVVCIYNRDQSIFRELVRADTQVIFQHYMPYRLRKQPLENVGYFCSMYKEIRKSNLIIIGGGGIFYDNEAHQVAAIQWIEWFLRITIARIHQRNICFLNIGIDIRPAHYPLYKTLFLGGKTQVIVRDKKSRDIMDSLKIRSTLDTDSVIKWREFLPEIIPPYAPIPAIGISLRSGYRQEEKKAFQQMVHSLRINYPGRELIGLAFSHRDDEDMVSDTHLLSEIGLDRVVSSSQEILTIIPTLECMIAVRLHAMILARICGVATLCLSYAHKTKELHHTLDTLSIGRGDILDITKDDLSEILPKLQLLLKKDTP